jgi:hypothetical protein
MERENGNCIPLFEGEVIMAWGFFRIGIFITAFLFGLLFSGSGGSSENLNKERSVAARQATPMRSTDSHYNLVRTEKHRFARNTRFTRM